MSSGLPIVLVVDPVASARFTLWRLLSTSCGVLEATDARRAREWLGCRQDIDALVVQRELPDADGNDFVRSLVTAGFPAGSRAVVVGRPVDRRKVVTSLVTWCFSRDAGMARALMRASQRVS